MQLGSESFEAIHKAEKARITVYYNACIIKSSKIGSISKFKPVSNLNYQKNLN